MTENHVGKVDHFFGRIKVATVSLDAPVRKGDWLRIRGANDDLHFRVRSMEVDHKPIEKAEPGQVVGIKVPAKAHSGSEVLRSDARPGFWARLLSWGS